MTGYIFAGGEIFPEYITERPEEGDICVCADSGYENARALGVEPDVLVGDLDSIGEVPDGVEIIRVPAEKDITDTHLAVSVALERGARSVVIVGSTAGRLDHALSTIAILEDLYSRHVSAVVVNGQNRVRFIRNSGHILLRSANYKYFSVIAADATVKGVSIDGAKYPLINKTLKRSEQFAVSNEIEKNAALINVKKGGVFIIESRDIK